MSERLKAVRGGSALAVGLVFSQCMTFVRNTALIRILTTADWGIALAFATTLTFLDTMSDLSADKQLVQADEHEQYDLQGATQLAYSFRGIWNSLLICLFANFIAKTFFFGMSSASWAFRYIALIPLMRGFMNQDYHRVQRRLQFWPAILVEVIPNGTITLLALPYAYFFKDYSAMLWLLLTDAALTLIVSHVVAESRYRWKFDRKLAARVFHFSWPLTINSGLMWFVLQGDRAIVGKNYSAAQLGIYGAVVALVMVPTNTIHRVSASVLLPMFSRCKTNLERVRDYYSNYMAGMSLVAALMCGMLIAIGGPVTVMFYTKKYAGAGPIIGWLAFMFGLRLLRSAPSVAALAYADSRNLMFANLVRFLGMAPMIYLGIHQVQLYWIAAAGVFAEALSVVAAIGTLAKYHAIPIRLSILPCALLIFIMSGAAVFPLFASNHPNFMECFLRGLAVTVTTLILYSLFFPHFRQEVLETLSHYYRRNDPRMLAAELRIAQTMESGLDGQLEISGFITEPTSPTPPQRPADDAGLPQAARRDVADAEYCKDVVPIE